MNRRFQERSISGSVAPASKSGDWRIGGDAVRSGDDLVNGVEFLGDELFDYSLTEESSRNSPSLPGPETEAASSSEDVAPEAKGLLQFPMPQSGVGPWTEKVGSFDPALQQICQLFGEETVLIPADSDHLEKMVWSGKPLSLAETKAASLRETLTKCGIAVQLGGASSDLCAVLAKTEATMKGFLTLNPSLSKTLITRGPAGFAIFLRVTSLYPGSKTSEHLLWLADGIDVVVLDRGSNGRYSVEHPAPVIAVPFASIRWPAGMEGPMHFGLAQAEYGPPSYPHKSRGRTANEYFWGAYLAFVLRLRFAAALQQFCEMRGGEDYVAIAEEEASGRVARSMIRFAKHPEFAFLVHHCNPRGVKRIMTAIRSVACLTLPDPIDELEEFICGHLEASRGSNLTSLELFREHERQARAAGRVPYPQTVFFRRIPALIFKHFRVRRCKRVRRGTVCQRGFNSLRFKSAAGQEEARGEPNDL